MILVNVVYGIEFIRGHHFLISWCVQTQSKESTVSYRIFRFCAQILIYRLINMNDKYNGLLLLPAHKLEFFEILKTYQKHDWSVPKKWVFDEFFVTLSHIMCHFLSGSTKNSVKVIKIWFAEIWKSFDSGPCFMDTWRIWLIKKLPKNNSFYVR